MKKEIIFGIDLESLVHANDYLPKDLTGKQKKEMDAAYTIRSTRKTLNLLNQFNANATFFISGEIYDWYPELIEEIAKKGHEIAFHSYDHRFLRTNSILKDQLKKSDVFIKKYRPKGFRAPSIYLKRKMLGIIQEKKFIYDSSIYDCKNMIELRTRKGRIIEVPVSSYSYTNKSDIYFPKIISTYLLTKEIPFGSGYFIGFFGKKINIFIKNMQKKGKAPVMFAHQWQIMKRPTNAEFLKLPFIIRHPLYIPYIFNVEKTLITLLKNNKFISTREFLEKEGMI